MDNPIAFLDSLIEKGEAYAKTSIKLAKLQVLESSIAISVQLAARLILLAVFSFFAILLNFGIALLIGKMLGHMYLGFIVLAGFYLIVSIILYFFLHRWIQKPVSKFIIKHTLR